MIERNNGQALNADQSNLGQFAMKRSIWQTAPQPETKHCGLRSRLTRAGKPLPNMIRRALGRGRSQTSAGRSMSYSSMQLCWPAFKIVTKKNVSLPLKNRR
jgi:hypothetical protein